MTKDTKDFLKGAGWTLVIVLCCLAVGVMIAMLI